MKITETYSITFEARKSVGNYDRKVVIKERNIKWSKVKQLVNKYHPLGINSSGWYIRSITLLNETNNIVKMFVRPEEIQAGKTFDELKMK